MESRGRDALKDCFDWQGWAHEKGGPWLVWWFRQKVAKSEHGAEERGVGQAAEFGQLLLGF